MKETYEINLTDCFNIYKESKEFQEVINSGNFVFCENKVVINDEKYVALKEGRQQLTEYAKMNEAECCLVFDVREITMPEEK